MSYDDDDDDREDRVIPADDADLSLVKTRLRIHDDELQRINRDGGYLLRVPLDDISAIQMRTSFDPICLIFFAAAVAVAAIAYSFPDYAVIGIFLYLAAVALIALGCFGLLARRFQITMVDGETYVPCDDTPDEGECFVISVRRLLRTRADHPRRDPRDRPDPDTGIRL